MMARGRVITREEARAGTPLPRPAGEESGLPFGKVVPKVLVDANAEAQRLLAQAQAQARVLIAAAERKAADLKLLAEAEARAEATAKLAAHALTLASYEAKADERNLERTVALARLLAERLLGASLAVAPEQISELAKQALSEARGARRLTIAAHPEDARLLSDALPSMGVVIDTVQVVPDKSRQRGSLRIETDIGVLDADLAPQLDRLALRLRETLSHES